MNRRIILYVLMALVSLQACKGRGDTTVVSVADTTTATADTLMRSSITFILGKDNSAYNQYYTMANHYYRLNPDDRTEVVVDSLTSLSQVLDYLQKHPAGNGLPYAIVNLVSHGNEFIDLQATVTPRGARISPRSIQEALADSVLVAPDSTVVDGQTLVYLHGCAVGQNQALLDGLAEAFGSKATVKASKLFEYYAYLSSNRNPSSIRHYFARTWYVFYHPDSVFNEEALVQQLCQRYPHDTVHWHEGLRRRFQNNPSELYHYSFIVPCLWDEFYGSPEDLPIVNTRSRRAQWMADNDDFRALLTLTHIPLEYFQTKFYRQTYRGEDDNPVYGLRVRARAGVICLIQPLVCADSSGLPYAPYHPNEADSSVFAFSPVGAYGQSVPESLWAGIAHLFGFAEIRFSHNFNPSPYLCI